MPRKKKVESVAEMEEKDRARGIVQKSLLDLILEERERGEKTIQSMLSVRPPEDQWRGLIALPPGTLVEDVVSEFDAKSNIPLEIPFFTFFHYVASHLLYHGITLKVNNTIIRPDIWTVLLADSGAGKTFATKQLQLGIPELKDLSYDIGGIASTAKFVEILHDNNNKLFFRDEFAEMYHQIKNAIGPLAEMKDTLLRLYNKDTISRNTKKEDISIVDAAIVFLAVTVKEALSDELTAQDMINGFAQRFSFIIAPKDLKKDFIDYPLWEIDVHGWQEKWKKLISSINYKEYIAAPNSVDAFKTTFRMLVNRQLDESFYRRQLWKAHKYALIYHILLGRGDKQLVESDCYGWAARLVHMLIYDCLQLLKDHGLSELEDKIQRVEKLQKRLEVKDIKMTPRLIVQNINKIKTVAEAKAIFDLVQHS